MKSLFSFLLISICMATFSCSKSSNTPLTPDTQLKITVTDMTTGLRAAGATVKLYLTLADWQAQTNSIGTEITDATGEVIFKHLGSATYYWYASSGCKDSYFESNTSTSPIPQGSLSSFNVGIKSTGFLKFINNFPDPCRIEVNGIVLIPAMPANTQFTQKMGMGIHNVRVVRLSGGVYDQTFTGPVTCGTTLITTFP